MKIINLPRKISMHVYEYADKEQFKDQYAGADENLLALYIIWQEGMSVYIALRRVLFWNVPVAFASLIDCANLSGEAKKLCELFDIPKKYGGVFINDFRVAIPFRGKGYGKMIASELIKKKKGKYLLKAEEDGTWFWPRLGFKSTCKDGFLELVVE